MSRSGVTVGELWCVVYSEEYDAYDCQPCDFPVEQGWTVYCAGLSGRSQAEQVVERLEQACAGRRNIDLEALISWTK